MKTTVYTNACCAVIVPTALDEKAFEHISQRLTTVFSAPPPPLVPYNNMVVYLRIARFSRGGKGGACCMCAARADLDGHRDFVDRVLSMTGDPLEQVNTLI